MGPEPRHYLAPRMADASDLLGDVICVCPNDHARLEVGALLWGA
jgi:hypothetical protein